MHIIGDVKGRTCILVDDLVDTAGTSVRCRRRSQGGRATNMLSHTAPPGVVRESGRECRVLELNELVVTDTIPLSPEAELQQN